MKCEYSFHSKVVGSTFCGGQDIIKNELSEKDELKLIPEPDNKFDKNAIMVFWKDKRIGYLPKETSEKIQDDLEKYTLQAFVSEITGKDKNNAGCNIIIYVMKDEES